MTVPLAAIIAFHRKRPAMITADPTRFSALASVPVAAWARILTYAQLCAVAVMQTAATIVSLAAGDSYLKALIPPQRRVELSSRVETTTWTTATIGPPVGGLLVAASGPVSTLLVDAVSFLFAAFGWRPEQAPELGRRWLADTVGGWYYICLHLAAT